MGPNILDKIIDPLLEWFDVHARELPWRENPIPYRVWISEIMLQQTRVETARPYFERFVRELPDIAALAAVPEPRLLKLWEGLGYYSRARNLQRAAQVILERFGGELPSDLEELRSLPGIGEYTAGAIASIAFGKPTPAVDGNVLRVVCRLLECRDDIGNPATKRRISEALQQIYPPTRCGDFTQSLMELGATVCLPGGAPRCEACPLAEWCKARQHGSAGELPVKNAAKPRRIEEKTIFLLRAGEQIALRRREDQGLLAGLWEFPAVPGNLNSAGALEQLQKWGITCRNLADAGTAKHIFSHLEWHMQGYLADTSETLDIFTWVSLQALEQEIALPSALKFFKSVLLTKFL